MRSIVTCVVIGLFLAACSVDPNAEANKLFVEAQKLIGESRTLPTAEKLRSLRSAQDKLTAIVSRYPTSQLAVQLASGQTIGDLSIRSIANSVRDAEWVVCVSSPSRPCLLNEALTLVESFKDKVDHVHALTEIGRAHAKAGLKQEARSLFERARRVADSIPHEGKINDFGRGTAMRHLAAAQAEAGLIAEALEATGAIKDDQNREMATLQVAVGQAKAGRTQESFALAQTMAHHPSYRSILEELAAYRSKAQAEAGQFDEALRTAASLDPKFTSLRMLALASIASALAKAGRSQEAVATLKIAAPLAAAAFIEHTQEFFKAQVNVGQTLEAIASAKAYADNLFRDVAFYFVGEACATTGDIKTAQELVALVQTKFLRAELLIRIASAQDKANATALAARTRRDALELLEVVRLEKNGARALGVFAASLP